MKYFGKCMSPQSLKYDMNMIGHDAPSMKKIFLSFIEFKGFADNLRDTLFTKNTGAISTVKILFNLFRIQILKTSYFFFCRHLLFFWTISKNLFSFLLQLLPYGDRYGISQTEANMIRYIVQLPMRKKIARVNQKVFILI